MALPLPGWVVPDRSSIEREAEPYRNMLPAERLRRLAAACKAGARLLRARPDRERVLAHEGPLPESTVVALARLRREAREQAGG